MARPRTKTEVTFPGTDQSLPLDALKASIAAELAAGLSDAEGIKKTYGMSHSQWEMLRTNPTFAAMLKEAIEKLSGAANASKRITMKSEIALEDSIPVLYQIAHDPEAQSTARIESVKTMAQLAGRNTKEGAAAGTGGGFNLILNLGNGKGITIEGTPVKPAIEHE